MKCIMQEVAQAIAMHSTLQKTSKEALVAAGLEDARAEALLASAPIPGFTPYTLRAVPELLDAIRACDKASYCVMGDGVRNPGEWWLTFRSVIVFGRIEIVASQERALEISRSLSYVFTSDEDYIRREIDNSGPAVLVFSLVPEHITGKTVAD